jgi:hypothetical protein
VSILRREGELTGTEQLLKLPNCLREPGPGEVAVPPDIPQQEGTLVRSVLLKLRTMCTCPDVSCV